MHVCTTCTDGYLQPSVSENASNGRIVVCTVYVKTATRHVHMQSIKVHDQFPRYLKFSGDLSLHEPANASRGSVAGAKCCGEANETNAAYVQYKVMPVTLHWKETAT